MRVAIISDVHGNRFALGAVLEDIGRETPDLLANLGDSVWGASDPAGAWRLLQGLEAVTVRGNTDEMVSSRYDELDEAKPYADWLRAQLPQDAPDRLAALPLTAEVAEGEVLLAHGSLRDPWEPLMLEVGDEAFSQLPPAAPRAIAERIAGVQAKVIVVGHTHRELISGVRGVTVVNAGPVSRPFDQHPAARWLLLERRSGSWNVQFRRVPYDVQAAVAWAKANSPFGEQESRLLQVG